MEKAEYQKHFELEEKFWWFRGRREILLSILSSRIQKLEKITLLDAGCGTGYNIKFFAPSDESFGCDFSEDAIRFSRKRGLMKLARADVQRLPFKDRSFDLILLLDVISHKSIKKDTDVLKGIASLLKDGGHLLLADNAFRILRSHHDAAYHVRERYTKKTLRKRLEAAGFSFVRGSYFNFFLFPPVFLIRLRESLQRPKGPAPESDLKAVPPRLNSFLYSILRLEAALTRHLNLPWGSSVICLARKGHSPD